MPRRKKKTRTKKLVMVLPNIYMYVDGRTKKKEELILEMLRVLRQELVKENLVIPSRYIMKAENYILDTLEEEKMRGVI